MDDIEYKKHMSEQKQTFSPLKPHWLKKDFVQPCEAVLIYYQIEPAKGMSMGRNDQIINAVDYLEIYDVLMSSEFIIKSARSIKLIDFIKWLINKDFEIPEHFKSVFELKNNNIKHSNDEKTNIKKEILNFDLKKMRPDQLQKLISRAYAAYYWKKKKSIISANELVTKTDFRNLMELIDADKIDGKTKASWISDLGSRSKKHKN